MAVRVVTRSIDQYLQYGESPGSTLWIWKDDRLEEAAFGHDVYHYKVWGYEATQVFYRGRHDPNRQVISVMPPESLLGMMIELPSKMREALERRFPGHPIVVFSEGV